MELDFIWAATLGSSATSLVWIIAEIIEIYMIALYFLFCNVIENHLIFLTGYKKGFKRSVIEYKKLKVLKCFYLPYC